ncbi:MAG TPA: LysE family transporter [Thermoanaerobaculia bacterium]|jgi:threonine/homoserine/homoserine lactone efflux protein|nr:LysE family transporter [Thermoanaerobaculia bacterium]
MEPLIGAAGALAAAALTPGPNNFVVMRTAARRGLAGALSAIAGIILGSLAMLAVVVAGAGAAFAAVPRLRAALAVGGCSYLVFLGVRLVAGAGAQGRLDAAAVRRPDRADAMTVHRPAGQEDLPAGTAGLFGFQFVNPKSWILVLTVAAAAPAEGGPLAQFARLAPLFAVIPAAALLLWAALGVAAKGLAGGPGGAWLDRALGGLLVVSALALLAEAWNP